MAQAYCPKEWLAQPGSDIQYLAHNGSLLFIWAQPGVWGLHGWATFEINILERYGSASFQNVPATIMFDRFQLMADISGGSAYLAEPWENEPLPWQFDAINKKSKVKIWHSWNMCLDLWCHWWYLCLWCNWWCLYLYLICMWCHDLHDVMIYKLHLDKSKNSIYFVSFAILGR